MIHIPKRPAPKNIEFIEERYRPGRPELKLTDEQRQVLMELARGPAYDVLLDLMMEECIAQETILVNTHGNEEKVRLEHAMARAMWVFFVRLQKRVQAEVTALLEPEADPLDAEVVELLGD